MPGQAQARRSGDRRAAIRRSIGVAALLIPVAAACSSGGSGVDLVSGVTVEVEARDNIFEPESTTVAAGTEVRFLNVGRNDHNVIPVSDDQEDLLVETEDLGPGAEATVRLTDPGTYRYYCSIHGTARAGMIGTIEVTG